MGLLSNSLRDFDLWLLKGNGEITEQQKKAEILRRDMKELRKEPFLISVLIFSFSILGHQMGIPVYILGGMAVYPILKSIVSTWTRLAEMETDITYLESGLELIRK